MNPVQGVFPKYTAAAAQIGTHGKDAVNFAKDAVKAPDTGLKLDNAWRSYNSFDHAVTATEQLPLDAVIPGFGRYRAGYQAARTAAHLIIASGAVPGARERVGKQELLSARESLHKGIGQLNLGDTPPAGDDGTVEVDKYNQYRALDFLGGSVEDATNGLVMLRKGQVALPLLRGLNDVRDAVAKNKPVDPAKLTELDKLFAEAGSELDTLIAEQQEPVSLTPDMTKALNEADELLLQAAKVGSGE